MKYLIIGAGGTGGAVGAYMAKAGKDVALIARGAHLMAMKKNGIRVIRPEDEFTIEEIKACSMEEYNDTPDIIFVCVKGYSVAETIPFIKRVAGKDTIVIPILNLWGTGGKMQLELPEMLVTDGCIYIASEIKEPGVILMRGNILRVIFGARHKSEYRQELEVVEKDLKDSEILGILSNNIQRDTLLKFSYVSAQSACGTYYNVPAEPMQHPGEIRDCWVRLMREIEDLANAMDIYFEEDIVERNLKIMAGVDPAMTTSMQRDLAEGKESEIDGQIFEVVRLADKYGLELPEYRKIAEALIEYQ